MPVNDRIGLEQLSYLSPARWGFAAVAAVAAVTDLIHVQRLGDPQANPGSIADPLWRHDTPVLLTNLLGIAGIAAVSITATSLLLRRMDPRIIRRRPQ